MTIDLSSLIPHIYLPAQLPQQEHDRDQLILEVFSDLLCEFDVPESIKQTFMVWQQTQRTNITLNDIKGDTAYYIKEQNCGILFQYNEATNELLYSDFICSVKSEEAMAPHDYLANFPSSCINIPVFEDIKIIQDQLNVLSSTQYPQAMSQSFKGGKSHSEIRDVPNPTMMEYLKSCLMDANSKDIKCTVITKKFRDDVCWNNALKPFRRSGMYMCLKVVLQLLLVRDLGELNGLVLYKSFIIHLHCHILQNSPVNANRKLEMMDKIGRRMMKLNSLINSPDVSTAVQYSYDTYYTQWLSLINQTNANCHEIWQETINLDNPQPFPKINFTENDLFIHFDITIPEAQPNPSNKLQGIPEIPNIPRHVTASFFDPNLLTFSKSSTVLDKSIILHDFEHWMMHHAHTYMDISYLSQFNTLFNNYYLFHPFYKSGNEIQQSRCYLYLIKLIYIVDAITIVTCPIYSQYNPLINPQIISQLYFQTKSEFMLASELHDYFTTRINNGKYPGLFDTTIHSFYYKYTQLNHDSLFKMKQQIAIYDQNKEELKRLEIVKSLNKYNELINKSNLLECQDFLTASGRIVHDRTCRKCHLTSIASNMRLPIYERLLTGNNVIDDVVLAMFILPPCITCLRDILYNFNLLINSITTLDGHIYGTWDNRFNKLFPIMPSKVQFASNLKSTSQSHYANIHCKQPINQFITDCGYNCILSVSNKPFKYNLQFDLNFSSLNPNSHNLMIATLHNCPKSMLLHEYMAYNNLQYGLLLHYRHLFVYLNQSLLIDPTLYNIILNLIYKYNSNNAHIDGFYTPLINAYMLKIRELINENRNNVNTHFTMNCLILICKRFGYFNANEAIVLLNEIRCIVHDWSLKYTELTELHLLVLSTFGLDISLSTTSVSIWIHHITHYYNTNPTNTQYIHNIGISILPKLHDLNAFNTVLPPSKLVAHNNKGDYIFTATSTIIQISVLTGKLLINHSPIHHLPTSITNHPTYISLIGNTKLKATVHGSGYKSDFYYFELRGKWLSIINHHNNLYIPHTALLQCPYECINHTCWSINSNLNELIFVRDASIYKLINNKIRMNDTCLLAMNTATYNTIIAIFHPIALPQFIHICFENKNNKILIFLSRYNLHFTLNNGILHCNELNMQYEPNYILNTLVGFKNKLIFHNNHQICIIVPHAPLITTKTNEHVIVTADLSKLYPIKWFKLEIDLFLNRLKCTSTTSWLYCALLHGLTSHRLIDPFTKMTGHAMSVFLLQSSNIRSTTPYTPHDFALLQLIQLLSPTRAYYPIHMHCMQQIQYNHALHDYYDDYYIIYTTLINISNATPLENEDAKLSLYIRHINRYLYEPSYYHPCYAKPLVTQININHKIVSLVNCIRNASYTSHTCHMTILQQLPLLDARINHMTHTNITFPNDWFLLFKLAMTATTPHWIFVLSNLVIQNVDYNHVMLLQLIHANPLKFNLIYNAIKDTIYYDTNEITINHKMIHRLLRQHLYPIGQSNLNHLNDALTNELECITTIISHKWPLLVDLNDFKQIKLINMTHAMPTLQQLLLKWLHNSELHALLADIINTSMTCTPSTPIIPIITGIQAHIKLKLKYAMPITIHNTDIAIPTLLSNISISVTEIYETGILINPIQFCHFKANELPNCPFIATNNPIHMYMTNEIQASWVAYSKYKSYDHIDTNLYMEQQMTLLHYYTYYSDYLYSLIVVNEACMPNKSIKSPLLLLQSLIKHPNDLIGAWAVILTYKQQCIRCMQLIKQGKDVSQESALKFKPKMHPWWLILQLELNMMFRETQVTIALNLSNVLQLQCGQGKSSCIIPMIIAEHCNTNKSKIMQIVVLKSLYYVTMDLLKQILGNLINIDIYIFPFCRQQRFTEADLNSIYTRLKACYGNVIVTIPEYIESFHLSCILHSTQLFLKLEIFMKNAIINILDESDEILHYKHHLVYTIGGRHRIDGGILRWQIIEIVMSFYMELGCKWDTLEYTAYREASIVLVRALIKSDLIILPELEADLMLDFITNNMTINDINSPVLLVLRGVFAYDVLYSAINKRFRVNYGVNLDYKMTAVPFKYKDKPLENTEFGHVDMEIILTILSWLNYGINKGQMTQLIDYLILHDSDKLQGLIGTSSINTTDMDIMDTIQSKYSHDTGLIYIYLNIFVFPKELQQYDNIIASSGWDIYNASGFSGTDDTALLLPNIKQNNIKSLAHTNAEVLSFILKNDDYRHGVPIIETLVTNKCQLLIDCGALIMNNDNKLVSLKWLQMTKFDACLYFEDDKLMVIDTLEHVQPFNQSTFDLNQCLVYLDDSHTRGIDLQLPLHFKGAVTISHDICKDVFVQSCMRMRLLGSTHKLMFIASNAAHSRIVTMPSNNNTMSIIYMTMENTINELQNNFLNWAQSGLYHVYKEMVHKIFVKTKDNKAYGKMCLLKEQHNLLIYKQQRELQTIPVIVKSLFKTFLNKLPKYMQREYTEQCQMIIDHCDAYVPDVLQFKQLNQQEQQRELEQQVEQEMEKYKPKMATAYDEEIDKDLIPFINNENGSFIPWYDGFDICEGKTDLYFTSGFKMVVKEKGMDYMRMPMWIIQSNKILLIISPFEANRTIGMFYEHKSLALLLYQPKQSRYTNMMINDPFLGIGTRHAMNMRALMELFIFSGNLYFDNKAQLGEYVKAIGYVTRPRTEEEEKMFANGFIKDGYLIKAHQKKFGMENIFKRDPKAFIKSMANARTGKFKEESHVGKILLGMTPKLDK